MILKVNENIKYKEGSSLFDGFCRINNNSLLNIQYIYNALPFKSNGTHTLNINYAPLNNFQVLIDKKSITINGKDDKDIVLGICYLNSTISSNTVVRNQILTDNPKYLHREFSLDVARNYFGVEEIKKIIDELACNRINYLHLHLSDDQNFAIESNLYPLLNTKKQYTKKEIGDLVNYAFERGIETIPEIDIPGHMTHILEAYPHLGCKTSIKSNVMCLKKDNLSFIYSLIDEISELFPGKYFHFGCDELDLKNNKKCNNCYRANKKAIEEFINSVALYILNIGKAPIVWNDALQYGRLDEEIIVQKWINYHKNKWCMEEYDKGRKFIIGSTLNTYFDYPYSIIPLYKTYEYIPEIQGKEVKNILGISSHVWCEHIKNEERLEIQIFPRIQAFGETAWASKLDYKDFLNRLSKELKSLKKREVYFTDLDEVDKVDYKEIVNFLFAKTNMVMYSKPDYLEVLYLTLNLLSNTQNNKEIARDVLSIIKKKLLK